MALFFRTLIAAAEFPVTSKATRFAQGRSRAGAEPNTAVDAGWKFIAGYRS